MWSTASYLPIHVHNADQSWVYGGPGHQTYQGVGSELACDRDEVPRSSVVRAFAVIPVIGFSRSGELDNHQQR